MARPVKLAYIPIEPEDGTDESLSPIIFLHGATSSKEQWNTIPQSICNKTKRKAYVMDARNHGDSEWSDIFNFDINVDDLLNFLEEHNLEIVTLVGHSMGGITAMKTALKHPEKVEGIIVEDMGVGKIPEILLKTGIAFMGILRNVIELVPPQMNENEAKKFLLEIMMKYVPPEVKEEIQRRGPEGTDIISLKRNEHGKWQCRTNIEVLEKALKKGELMTKMEGVYKGPSVFICGEVSPFQVHIDAEDIRRHFPSAQLIGIKGAGHRIHAECPVTFTEAVLKFFNV